MASTNGSGRPSGSVSIPVEIIRDSSTTGGSGTHSRHNSPYRTLHNDNPYSGFSDSPPWTSNTTGRFQTRQSPGPAYDRLISNSQFNQPLNGNSSYQTYQEPQYRQPPEPQYRQPPEPQYRQPPEPQYRQPQQQMYEPGPSHFSRSSEDLLSSPFDSMRYSTQPQYSSLIPPTFGSGLRNDSDFVHPNKYSSPLGRSYDALNDFADMHQSFPTTRPYPSGQQRQQEQKQQQQQPYYRSTYQTQHQPQSQQQQPTYVNQAYINPNIVYTNEYGVPADHYQPNTFQGTAANDRSRSPNSQRGASPSRPPPTTSQLQQQEEPELKMAKDTDGPIPMPAPASSSSSPHTQSTDQQVPSTDASASINVPSPPPEPVRDPNTIALEKLEQLKQNLDALEKEVELFTGSTRNDRSYKVLDEQALKIMIRCDELVDVSPDIKEKRKEMIRNVERVIGKLESKVPATPAVENSNPMETATTSNTESSVNNNEKNISARTTTTEQSIPT